MKLIDALQSCKALMAQQRYAEAATLLEACTDPQAAQSNRFHRLYGEALRRMGRPQDAVHPLMQALALKVDDVDAYLQLAFALQSLGMNGEAAECFRTVAALQPGSVMAQAYLIHGEQHGARWQDFDANLNALLGAIRGKADDADDEFGVPFALIGLPHAPSDLLKAARLSTRYLTRGIRPLPPAPQREGQRLRIGYLSADFHAHATAALLVEVLESRDRERFEVLLFSHGIDDGSPLRQRVRQACDRFIDVVDQDLAGIAARIRAEQVDIVVDLKGHTADSRFAALAYRPAPVQVAWLGFPGTSGADFIDYLIGDPIVTPLDHAPDYSERIAQLPLCYQPNDGSRLRLTPPARAELGLPDDALVLLAANQVYKITPALFDAWMLILQRLSNAVLWQLSGGEQADAQLQAEAQACGVDAARLIFMPKAGMAQHGQRLGAADLALDSWPCNGHTTTSDALAAGVPVVSLLGQGFAARVAASVLNAAGLGELVCATADSYVDKVCALANDSAARAALRTVLDQPQALFDARRFAGELEALYLRMWARKKAGLAPADLSCEYRQVY